MKFEFYSFLIFAIVGANAFAPQVTKTPTLLQKSTGGRRHITIAPHFDGNTHASRTSTSLALVAESKVAVAAIAGALSGGLFAGTSLL